MAKVTCVLLLASFMQVEGSYFLAGWQLWWVHICKEPINWSNCLWCCPQLFLRPTQTYPPRPRLYQLIMPVPSESNYTKPHLHTPPFSAPFPSLTIYWKVIKCGFFSLRGLFRSLARVRKLKGTIQGLRLYFLWACHFPCHRDRPATYNSNFKVMATFYYVQVNIPYVPALHLEISVVRCKAPFLRQHFLHLQQFSFAPGCLSPLAVHLFSKKELTILK